MQKPRVRCSGITTAGEAESFSLSGFPNIPKRGCGINCTSRFGRLKLICEF